MLLNRCHSHPLLFLELLQKLTPQTRSNVPPTLSTISDTRGERDFMLAHDVEDAQELGDVDFVNAVPTSSVDPPQEASGEGESILASNSTPPNAAAAARGRDLGRWGYYPFITGSTFIHYF